MFKSNFIVEPLQGHFPVNLSGKLFSAQFIYNRRGWQGVLDNHEAVPDHIKRRKKPVDDENKRSQNRKKGNNLLVGLVAEKYAGQRNNDIKQKFYKSFRKSSGHH